MKMKADFHIHTHRSPDSGAVASEIVEQARKTGLDVIGVTDHNTTKGALEVRELAKGRPLVLVGQEVRTLSGEIIVFGPEKDIHKRLPLQDTCRMAKAMGGFVVVPHPFDRTRNGIGRDILAILDDVDAIEILNSRCLYGRANRKAAEFAAENEIPAIAGSDAHFPEEIGSCFAELDISGKLTEQAVFNAVSSGKVGVSGGRSGIRPHIRTALLRMKI